MYYAGKRLFNEKVGLLAAILLTLNPWHFQLSRWGHESTIAALLGLAPLALMLWSNIIPGDNRTPRPIAAGIAGMISGIGCYGYQPVRVFVPIFLFLIFILNPRQWLSEMKKPKYLIAVIIFTAGFMVFFGPLLWQHIFHPHEINRHFDFQPNHFGTVGLYESLRNTLIRYVQHFSPNFLFADIDYISPPGEGLFNWYMVPLFAAGLTALAARFKKSVSARITVAFILAYPVGDILAWAPPLSSVRSVVGLCGIILLAAIGGVDAIEWLRKRHKAIALTATAALVVIILILSVRYFHRFFGIINIKDKYIRNNSISTLSRRANGYAPASMILTQSYSRNSALQIS
jgi:4-amino-4-deoxy-L-arabinose transferase-like glycosyltransferase